MNKPNCCEKCLKIDYSSDTNVPLCNNLSCECHKVNASIKNCEKKSHYHCWNQTRPSACGIPLAKHTQCCLCDTKYDPTPSHHTWEKELKNMSVKVYPNQLPHGVYGDLHDPNKLKDFIAKIESDAIARTVQEMLRIANTNIDVYKGTDKEFINYSAQMFIEDYANAKGITINDTTI